MAQAVPALPPSQAADRSKERAGLSHMMFATPTAMLEQTRKSSLLSALTRKLHVDFQGHMSVVERMVDDDDIDRVKVRTGLFALVTANLEDAHEIAVKGQSFKIDEQQAF